jgi:choline dehydrogenase-like flavoprotein
VLRDGSSVNAEVFPRSHPGDHDAWAEQGAAGWGFADIQRCSLRLQGNAVLSGDWHGTDRPLSVSNTPDPNPTRRAVVQSRQERATPSPPVSMARCRKGRDLSDHHPHQAPPLDRRGLWCWGSSKQAAAPWG